MKIFNSQKLQFIELGETVRVYLTALYTKSQNQYKSSSPFGQILNVINEYFKLLMLYLEDTITENNILTANKQSSIYGISRISGHNPTRGLSAQGNIKIKISKSATSELNASYIIIPDGASLKCLNNNQLYFIQIGNSLEHLKLSLDDDNYTSLKIIQGELETQSVIAKGGPLQSFNISTKGLIENEMVWVLVNGEMYETVDSLYDMKNDEKLCMIKTGISDGIDIYFGNENFGIMPIAGDIITIKYVKTIGAEGNILSNSAAVTWKWNDPVYTNLGEEINLNKVIITEMENPLILGADSESSELTKLIAPHTSRSFVLANTNNYINFLSRFNYEYVDAYTKWDDEDLSDDNVVYLFMLPRISTRLRTTSDYFSVPVNLFVMSDYEKTAIKNYINKSGTQIMGTEVIIVDPIVKKYSLNIIIRIFDTYDKVQLTNEITSRITEYLIQIKRRDRIPKSDIIAIIEAIPGIDSVNISFVSEENELAIRNGAATTSSLGIDEFGDIIINKNEIPLIRGGWYDRYGNLVEDGIHPDKTSSINISIKSVIKETNSIKMMNNKKNNL